MKNVTLIFKYRNFTVVVRFIGLILFLIFCFNLFVEAEQGLVGWWKFDEDSGEILHDSSGNKNDGKIYGATWVKDKLGNNALLFDGKDDYVECGNNVSLQIGGPITITTWINLHVIPENIKREIFVISKGGWNIVVDGPGIPCFWFKDVDTNDWVMVNSGGIPLNEWFYIAAVYNVKEGMIYTYKDGLLNRSFKYTGSEFTDFDAFGLTIGGYRSGNRSWDFHGLIGETKIYNRALSAKEIGSNYLLETKTKEKLNEEVAEFLKKYMHYYPCFDIFGGDAKKVVDETAVGGYALHGGTSSDVCYIWWEGRDISGLKPGNYNIYLRAKGNGLFRLIQYNAKTEEYIKGFPHIKIDSSEYKLYYIGEFNYDGSYILRLTDSSSSDLWLDYIFLTPVDVVIE